MIKSYFFHQNLQPKGDVTTHIVIPTSVDHFYENSQLGQTVRNAIYIKKYGITNQEINPVIFFHGGPAVVNQGQFGNLTRYFTQLGHAVYIPEIEGSSMYSDGKLPEDFDPKSVPENLKLLSLNEYGESGLNEFTKNYADDVKDVINYVSTLHPNKKINIITHSLGGHQLLRTLQHYKELSHKIEAICSIAGTYDMGLNRFWSCLKKCRGHSISVFYPVLGLDCQRVLKSMANENQMGPTITGKNNPSVDPLMNQEISVHYGDVSNFPPMMLVHAKNDSFVFFQCSILLYEKMRNNGCIVNGLFLEDGEHQFIKDEGDETIRNRVLKEMHTFFNYPINTHDDILSNLNYEDIVTEHKLFLEDQRVYLESKFYQSPALT